MRILIAEDEIPIARGLKFLLEKECYTVDIVHDGQDALEYCHQMKYDVVVLDIMMPRMSGMEVLFQLRREKYTVPIMMLTARAELEDRVEGLMNGADDYLPKPFATQEFIARVKALTRRSVKYHDDLLKFGDIELDCNCYKLHCKNETIRLNNKEFQMMELFITHPHFIFSAEHLMEKIWDLDSESDINVVWTYIGYVRRKLKTIGAGVEIRTVRGAGYSLEETTC